MNNNSTIKCPNCQHEFPIGNALSQSIEDEIKKRYVNKYNEDQKKLSLEKSDLAKQAEELQKQIENQNIILNEKLKLEKNKIQEDAVKKAAEEIRLQMDALNKELTEKDIKLKESTSKELDLMKREKELKEQKENAELEMQKKVLEREKEIEDRIRKMEGERNELKMKELQKKLDDQTKLAEEMQRKAEQGSMQLQGEVQELALENLLRSTFPFDHISEVAKGVRGADCLQMVRNNTAKECGKIIYESKRTKSFSNEWIEKLKTDMRSEQADIAIIVTETMPKEMDTFGLKDGVYICRFSEVKAVAMLLRDTLIKINSASVNQENKGEKMQMLYNFLTGNEFRQNIEAVIEGFSSLKRGITNEKNQMEKLWKEREKQLEKVLLNANQFFGSINGIAGNEDVGLKMLE